MSKEEEYEFDLKQSLRRIGQIYDIIMAADGEILDGYHRIEELKRLGKTPNVKKLGWCKTEEQKLMVRTQLNLSRRKVSAKETSELINARAEQLLKQGFEPGHIGGRLIKAGWSRKTVYEYLDKKYQKETVSLGTESTLEERTVSRETDKKKKKLSWKNELVCPHCNKIIIVDKRGDRYVLEKKPKKDEPVYETIDSSGGEMSATKDVEEDFLG